MTTTTENALPDTGYLRQTQLIGCREIPGKRPACKGIIPFSATTLWRKVAAGQFPKPVKLSAGVTAWKVEAIRAWMQEKDSPAA